VEKEKNTSRETQVWIVGHQNSGSRGVLDKLPTNKEKNIIQHSLQPSGLLARTGEKINLPFTRRKN